MRWKTVPFIVVMLASATAHAAPGDSPWAFPAGVNVGGVIHPSTPGGFLFGGEVSLGFVVRPMLTLGFVTAYSRFGWVPSDPISNHFVEVGALLKFPFNVFGPTFVGGSGDGLARPPAASSP